MNRWDGDTELLLEPIGDTGGVAQPAGADRTARSLTWLIGEQQGEKPAQVVLLQRLGPRHRLGKVTRLQTAQTLLFMRCSD